MNERNRLVACLISRTELLVKDDAYKSLQELMRYFVDL